MRSKVKVTGHNAERGNVITSQGKGNTIRILYCRMRSMKKSVC